MRRDQLLQLLADEAGATAIEYGLIVALISIAIMVALGSTGEQLNVTFGTIDSTLSDANS